MTEPAKTPPTKTNGKSKVAREVAEAEFVRMCDARRIEHDTSELTDAEKKAFAATREGIVRLIMRGAVVISEKGDPTYTPVHGGDPLTFYPPTGATLMALETYPGERNIANTMAAMGDMTHTDPGTFSKLHANDVQACSKISNLFLADR